ncbi:COG4315 family predicted lipoprotein [Balneatrix alpica]|uniref:COG4315 family predicted lipoprotein n=1 Tax=Balneatrix alpica TaxID=75684 RepID=UPI002739B9B1|nr:hypothetical protein [Balneatrix alpica]
MNKMISISTFAFSLLAAGSVWAEAPIQVHNSAMGEVLANQAGMTLYTFKKDSEGMSNCYDQCAQNWPPLMATEGDMAEGDYSLVTRKDGGQQWAYKGMPLYLWVKDQQPGDTSGHGVKDVWEVAKP